MLYGLIVESIRQKLFIAQRIRPQNKQYRLRSRGTQATFFSILSSFVRLFPFVAAVSALQRFSGVNLFLHPHTTYTRSATATQSELFLSIMRRN